MTKVKSDSENFKFESQKGKDKTPNFSLQASD